MRAPLTVAAVQPPCRRKDVRANALEHAGTIRRSKARVVVFPELSLTGYELDADSVSPDDEALLPVVAARANPGTTAFIGAPVTGERNTVHIGTLQVSSEGVEVAYRKRYLGRDEAKRFSPGGGAVARDVDGWRVGIGKDTDVDQHVADTAALHVDLYVAGLWSPAGTAIARAESAPGGIARACLPVNASGSS